MFYRLNVLNLVVPPLHEREGDIRKLLDFFLRRFSTKLKRRISNYSHEALLILEQYHYPGNVRELQNIVEYCANICQGEKVLKQDLPAYLLQSDPQEQPTAQPSQPQSSFHTVHDGWMDIEKEMILDALRKTGENRSKASKILGWGRTTLWRKINRYDLN